MPSIGKLISGFRVFKATTFQQKKDMIEHMIEQGQKPSTMVVTCSDLKLAPAELVAANPGELYIVSNVGGIVPKHNAAGVHGILSAIEYAVRNLEIENIIVLGHAKCDSIRMMMSDQFSATTGGLSESMKTWLSAASEARDAVKKELSEKSEEEQQVSCEHESIIISLRNLMAYPYIAERMTKKKLNVFGWHFDIEAGEIMAFNQDSKFFEPII